MRVTTLRTRFGQEIPLGGFTVLVGANNVGKSQTLRDINTKVVQGPGARTVLLESLTVEKPAAFDDLFRGLQAFPIRRNWAPP